MAIAGFSQYQSNLGADACFVLFHYQARRQVPAHRYYIVTVDETTPVGAVVAALKFIRVTNRPMDATSIPTYVGALRLRDQVGPIQRVLGRCLTHDEAVSLIRFGRLGG